MRKLFLPFLILTGAMFAYAPVVIALAPYESTMLLVQKIFYAVNIWRTIHPATSVVPTLGPGLFGAFWYCVAALMLFFLVFLALRLRVEHLSANLDELYRAEEPSC